MEYFYRDMRKRYGLLMGADQPEGGNWNCDADNLTDWREQCEIPARSEPEHDGITCAVIAMVEAASPDPPGDLSTFRWAVTHDAA